MKTVSVVIPTLNAGRYLPDLLQALHRQRRAPLEVVIVDSGSSDATPEVAAADEWVRWIEIEHFTHGRARNLGAREARGDLVAFLTQDALPADACWLEELVRPLEAKEAAAVYGRQVPRDDATPMERYYLAMHFPPTNNPPKQYPKPSSPTDGRVPTDGEPADASRLRPIPLCRSPFADRGRPCDGGSVRESEPTDGREGSVPTDGVPTDGREPADGEARGLTHRDIFFSNVSSAVDRQILLKHPFDEAVIMSEDQQLARDLLLAGYAVVYAPRSVVVHSHRYPLKVVFQRYLDSAFAVTELLPRHGLVQTVAAGCRYVAGELGFMLRRHPLWLPYYLVYNVVKTAGVLAGHAARHLPPRLLRRLSLHAYHWERRE